MSLTFAGMEDLLKQIDIYKSEIAEFSAEKDIAETFRIKYLGTKGLVKEVMSEMRNVPNDKKREFGQVLNEFKIFAEKSKFSSSSGGIVPAFI